MAIGSSGVILLSHSGFVAYNNQHYIVVGEVKNIGNVPIKNVKVTVTLYNENNEVLYNCTQPTFLEVIPRNGKSPFVVMWFGKDKTSEVARYSISNFMYEESVGKPEKLEIVWSGYSFPDVIGEIRNNGDKNATSVKVIAMFYNKDGNIIGANSDLSIYLLPPNTTKEFHVTFPFMEDAILQRAERYEIIAESREYSLKTDEGDDENTGTPINPYRSEEYIVIIILATIALTFYVLRRTKQKRKHLRKRRKMNHK